MTAGEELNASLAEGVKAPSVEVDIPANFPSSASEFVSRLVHRHAAGEGVGLLGPGSSPTASPTPGPPMLNRRLAKTASLQASKFAALLQNTHVEGGEPPGGARFGAPRVMFSPQPSGYSRGASPYRASPGMPRPFGQRTPQGAAVVHGVAGACGAVVALLVVYPLDNLRTRIQCSRRRHEMGVCGLRACEEVLRREGVRGLYCGLKSALLGVGVSWAVYYFLYALLRRHVRKWRGGKFGVLDNLVLSFAAGMVSAVAANPVWVISTRAKLRRTRGLGMWGSLRDVLQREGIAGLFAGLGPSLVLLLNPAIQFAAYDRMKAALRARRIAALQRSRQQAARTPAPSPFGVPRLPHAASPTPPEFLLAPPVGHSNSVRLTAAEHLAIGAASKFIALLVTYPYQVVKARAHAGVSLAGPDFSREGTVRCLFKILEFEGIGGLYRGLPSKLLASTLTAAIMLTTYERLVVVIWDMVARYTRWRHPPPTRFLQPPSTVPTPSPPSHRIHASSVVHPSPPSLQYR